MALQKGYGEDYLHGWDRIKVWEAGQQKFIGY